MTPKKFKLILGILAVLVIGALSLSYVRQPVKSKPELKEALASSKTLSLSNVNDSIELGIAFMKNNQKPEGNFNYSYNWETKTFDKNDNSVRQAGSVWGLSLAYQDRPDKALFGYVKKGIDYFNGISVDKGTYRYIPYGGERLVKTGTVSLVALAHIEVLRTQSSHLSGEARQELNRYLDGYLGYLALTRRENGLFAGKFNYIMRDYPVGNSDPYSNGEALLALVKAAKYLDKKEFIPRIMESADTMYTEFVEKARKKDPDSDTTKGFYQWGTMAYFELATSGWKGTEKYADHVLEMANWMIDVHRTMSRRKNTGYAQEGIIHAYEIARMRKDTKLMEKFSLVSDNVLKKLISWQVGHPIANSFIRAHYKDQDITAHGGFQNQKSHADLRIDVTQHTLHACLLARRYLY